VRRGHPLLRQAAQNHHDSLVDHARRNGLLLEADDAEAAPDLAAPGIAAAPAV
jgi:hypothetical protein